MLKKKKEPIVVGKGKWDINLKNDTVTKLPDDPAEVDGYEIPVYHKDTNTVTFETIINAIEYLITFFSSKQKGSVC